MLRVLIVDDDINVSACLRLLIPWKDVGCELIGTAANGQEGYNMAVELSPDIIICDIIMPVMDGPTLCKRVYETMSDVMFIFLSAYEDFTTAQLALQYHVQDYVLKPIDRNKINYLTGLLSELRQQCESKSYYTHLFHETGTGGQIVRALDEGDEEFFKRMFERLTKDTIASSIEIGYIRHFVDRLTVIIYDWLERSGIDCRAERAETFAAMRKANFKMDLIFIASECYFRHLRPDVISRPAYYEDISHQAEEYIDANISDPALSASTVAAHFNYSTDHLARIFRKYHERSLTGYITERRLELAMTMLKKNDCSINNVAEKTGFSNPGYFAQVFRKRFGLSPRDWRLRNLDKGRSALKGGKGRL